MKTRGTLFYHGYGVRGNIWRTLVDRLAGSTGPSYTPDLAAKDVDELVTLARGRARRVSLEIDGPVLLVGHSLGAVLAAFAAQEPGPPAVGGVVLIAPPYGEREHVPGPVMRLLLRHRLIPPALLRPRFFSSRTPVSTQREIFANAVPEAPALRELTLSRTFFHTAMFDGPLRVPSLVLASRADRIVPAHQSESFGRLLGSEVVVLSEDERVAHDDFFASPEIATQTAQIIRAFAERL
jgi:pimeloyl-ACP methyl ester carboxylesterase